MTNRQEMRKSKTNISLMVRNGEIEFREMQVGEEDGSTTAPAVISGYAAVFDEESTGLWWKEIIVRGAFDGTDFSGCKAVFNHDENIILGSISGGNLKLEVDERGLKYTVELPDTQLVKDMVIAPMRRGDLDKSSFRFTMDWSQGANETWHYDRDRDVDVRKIHKIASVLDVSPVLFAAYDAADSSIRSMMDCSEFRERADEARNQSEASAINVNRYYAI